MKTILERAKERADRHAVAEAELYHGLGHTYAYPRIYDSEIVSYEQGAKDQRKEDILKAWDWILTHTNAVPGDAGDFIKTMENN